MKKLALGLLLAFSVAGAAFAADDPMATRYGNTVVVKNAAGQELQRIYYNEDKTITVKMADGTEVKGSWEIKDGKICVTQKEPAPADPKAATVCNPFSGSKQVGESWSIPAADGSTLTVTLVAGRP